MPIGDLLAQISGAPNPSVPTRNTYLPPKHKQDEPFRKPAEKLQKIGTSSANTSRPIAQSNQTSKPAMVNSLMAKTNLGPNRQGPSMASHAAASSLKDRQSTPVAGGPPKAPPKKGSFAEIMARGKAAQATMGPIGKIQHKKIEKTPSKRERENMKAQKSQNLQKNLAPGSKFMKASQSELKDGRNGASKSNVKARAEPVPEKKVKKAATATTGYAGTSRPKPGGASGPSRPLSSASASRYGITDRNTYGRDDRYASSGRGARYAYPSEEEEEEEQDYESDVSSDMEAAVFEVDDEEREAESIAKREDREALAEENRLKKEKEEKRRRLTAMAKARR